MKHKNELVKYHQVQVLQGVKSEKQFSQILNISLLLCGIMLVYVLEHVRQGSTFKSMEPFQRLFWAIFNFLDNAICIKILMDLFHGFFMEICGITVEKLKNHPLLRFYVKLILAYLVAQHPKINIHVSKVFKMVKKNPFTRKMKLNLQNSSVKKECPVFHTVYQASSNIAQMPIFRILTSLKY